MDEVAKRNYPIFKILFDKEVKQLLSKMGRSFLGDAIV